MNSQNDCNFSVIIRISNRHEEAILIMHIVPLSSECPSQY